MLQEVAASNHRAILRSRDDTLSWPRFLSTVRQLIASPLPRRSLLDLELDRVTAVVEALVEGLKDGFKLLEMFHETACSNPIDRLYSLYGLVSDHSKHMLPAIDYTLSVTDVFIKLIMNYSASCVDGAARIMQALLKFGSLRDEDNTCPSWVPAWTRSCSPSLHPAQAQETCRATENKQPSKCAHSTWTVKEIGNVRRLLEPVAPVSSPDELDTCVRRISALLPGGPRSSTSTIALMQDILAALRQDKRIWRFGGTDRRHSRPPVVPSTREEAVCTWNKHFRNSLLCTYRELRDPRESSKSDVARIALVPASTRAGDHLVVLGQPSDIFGPTAHSMVHTGVETLFVLQLVDMQDMNGRSFVDLSVRGCRSPPGKLAARYRFLGGAWTLAAQTLPCPPDRVRHVLLV